MTNRKIETQEINPLTHPDEYVARPSGRGKNDLGHSRGTRVYLAPHGLDSKSTIL